MLSCVRLFAAPLDGSPPGFPVHGILQARILEWVARPFSRRSDRVPEELWTEVRDTVQEAGIKTIPKKKNCIKAKMVV